ncbi:cytochrome P450 [Hyaloraphidium curvatum]|nr:cytochrome P450 [Hyaloraphidium curvatum]
MGLLGSVLALPLPVLALLVMGGYFVYLLVKYRDRAIGTRARPDLPPSPTAVPLLGDMLSVGKMQPYRLEEMLRKTRAAGEGKVFRQTVPHPSLGPLDIINVSDPKDIEDVLRDPYLFIKGELFFHNLGDFLGNGIFNSDGERWHAQRKTASHVFNVKNFRDVFSGDFIEEVEKLCDHLNRASEAGALVDLQDLLLRCTLDSFGRLAMGTDFGCIAQEPVIKDGRYSLPNVEYMESFDFVNMLVSRRVSNPLWPVTERLSGESAKLRKSQEVMRKVADGIIAQKKAAIAKGEHKQKDMLDYFMATKNFEGGLPPDDELRDFVANIVIAGRDTTAQTLTWVFYCLANHPEVERKLREELVTVLGDKEPTYESLKELKYTNAVFNEALRLHANVPNNIMTATRDTVLSGSGTKIYAGDRVQYSPWIMGRLKSIWGPDAEEFKPERWFDAAGNLRKENQYKWPVFKAGPRICLGMNMATQEAMTFLAQIVRRFSLELVNEDRPEKWGKFDVDPAKREGRYGFALTLCVRDSMDFRVNQAKA